VPHATARWHSAGASSCRSSGDDWYEPDKLRSQVELFRTLDDDVGVVFANCNRLRDDDQVTGQWFTSSAEAVDGRIFDNLLRKNHIPAPTVMVRRAVFDAVGPYDESLVYEDDDMWLRVADRYQFRYLDRVVLNKRYLLTSLSHADRYHTARRCSRAELLLKWVGRNAESDAVIALRVWQNARRLLLDDTAKARGYLKAVYAFAPSPSRRALIAASGVPGFTEVLRRFFEIRDALKPRSRALLARVHVKR
jgi:hypothetical protein